MSMGTEREYTIAADPEKAKIGCVLIQRLMGATVPNEQLSKFDWTSDSMDGMKLYRITESQLDELVRLP